MKTEHRLAKALKEMMSSISLDSISVIELSKKCGVSRKTFYYHFHDIYDLLTLVFLDEKLKGIDDVDSLDSLLDCIYSYYDKNKEFIDATLESAGSELFQEFIYNNIYKNLTNVIDKIDVSKNVSSAEKKGIVRFYSSALSNSIVYYLSNFRNKTIQGLKSTLSFLQPNFLQLSIKQLLTKEQK